MSPELRYLDALQGSGIRPGLDRMRALLRAAGRPERRVPAILVAGTNGKGSTAATLASILTRSGYRTGLYTSPHLVSIRERWQIDGEPVAASRLREAIRRLQRLEKEAALRPTYFEALTILAFLLFDGCGCEVSVLEVGMGGRLDATNVVRPLASVVTPVGIDHAEWLGRTVKAIAPEKAGIIHRGSIAVTANRDAEVLRVLAARAAKFGAPLHRVYREVAIGSVRGTARGVAFSYRSSSIAIRLRSPLAGEHQVENVALAVRTAELLRPRLPRIEPATIVAGVAATRWRGRLELFPIGRGVWVDGAHNPHALARIAPFVARHLPRPRTLVFGVLRDKPFEEMAAMLVPLFQRVIVTEPPSERALPAGEAAERIADPHAVPVRAIADPKRAIRAALDEGDAVLVCGSLYLAGEAVGLLDRLTPSGRDEARREPRRERARSRSTSPRRPRAGRT